MTAPEYWQKKAEEARRTNEVTMIRFGGFGASGSETWSKGSKMRKDQLQKLRALIAEQSGESPEEGFGDLV